MRPFALLLLLAACGATPEAAQAPAAPSAPAAPAAPSAPAAAAASAAPTGAQAPAAWDAFGEAFPAASEVVSVKQLLDTPDQFAGKTLTVEGDISDVCQKKGCWMVVTDGDRTMRVTMKDHAFGVAKDSSGGHAQVYGEIVKKAVDPKTVEHYASESSKPDALPEKAAQDGEMFEVVASAVRIRKAR